MVDAAPSRARLIALGLAFYAALAAGGLAWMHRRGDPILEKLGAPRVGFAVGAITGLAVGLGVAIVTRTALSRARWVGRLRAELVDALRPLSIPLALGMAGASGVAEELLFRGALQPAVGLAATAIVFGALHGGLSRDFRGWAIFATLAGVVLGALANWSGGLLAPIAAHVTVNGVELVQLSRDSRRDRGRVADHDASC